MSNWTRMWAISSILAHVLVQRYAWCRGWSCMIKLAIMCHVTHPDIWSCVTVCVCTTTISPTSTHMCGTCCDMCACGCTDKNPKWVVISRWLWWGVHMRTQHTPHCPQLCEWWCGDCSLVPVVSVTTGTTARSKKKCMLELKNSLSGNARTKKECRKCSNLRINYPVMLEHARTPQEIGNTCSGMFEHKCIQHIPEFLIFENADSPRIRHFKTKESFEHCESYWKEIDEKKKVGGENGWEIWKFWKICKCWKC